ncbi:MAG: hypothetical protein QOF43_2519, partial [Gaiellaceae bacterium]|nr:hypothetical protein [Gaiellaceae bacterium]
RKAFFERTRKATGLLYAGLAALAGGCAAFAILGEPLRGALGVGVGLVAGIVLFALSPAVPTTARAARLLLSTVAPVGVVLASVLLPSPFSSRFVAGVYGGFMMGCVAGIAWIRRRLARDDELLLRQARRGFDPERPWRWMRRESS